MLTFFTIHVMLPYKVHGMLLPPKERYILQIFFIKFRMHAYSTHKHYMALPSLQPLTARHNKDGVKYKS